MTGLHIPPYGSTGEDPPTQDAYDAACRAIKMWRTRAYEAEALLEKVRGYVGGHNDGEVDVWSLREVLAGRQVRI